MGTFTVRATLSHPDRRETQVTLDLVVDTGATWSLIPPEAARSLGVEPSGTRPVRTAGEPVPCRIVFGEPGDAALVGLTVLEQLGLAVDPVQRRLVPTDFLLY